MADIDVVKKSSNTWLWILLAIVAVAAIVWFMSSRGTARQTGMRLDPAGPAQLASLSLHESTPRAA